MEHTTLKSFNAKIWKPMHVAAMLLLTLGVFAQTTVNYPTQTANFNAFFTEKNNGGGPYAGTYDNGGSELAQYANGGSFNNTPGAAAFQTFNTTGHGVNGAARPLQVGDRFTITAYVNNNPSAGGRIGISFRNTTAVTNFFSSTDANTVARFQIDDTGGWKVYHGGTIVQNTGATAGSDRTLSIEITSSNTFNATISGTTYFDLTFAASGPIAQMCIYTLGDNNANSFWKNASLTNIGHAAGTGLRFGYGLTSGTQNITGLISNGRNTSATSGTLDNKVLVGGSNAFTIFSAANTYTGGTTINANGGLELQHAQAVGSFSPLTVNNTGTLKLYSPTGILYTIGSLEINGTGEGGNGAVRNVGGNNEIPNVILNSPARVNADFGGSLTIGAVSASQPLTIGGTRPVTIIGSVNGGIIKDGSNVLTINDLNVNSMSSIAINAGTVSVMGQNSLANATVSFPSSVNAATLSIVNSIALENTLTVNNTKAIINVAADQGITFSNTISGTGRLTKTGAGGMNIFNTSTTLTGGVNIADGVVLVSNGNRLGTGTVNLGLDANDVSQPHNVALAAVGIATYTQPIVVASNASGATRELIALSDATANISGSVTLNGTLSISGTLNVTGIISGTGGLNILDGSPVFSGANTYTGNTTVRPSSVLFLGAANTMPNASNLILSGGTFHSTGFSDQMNLLLVESNSTISFGTGSHAIAFANSSEEPWAGTLTISGWNGTAGQSNTGGGRIIFGVDGLTPEQLGMITFAGYNGTAILLPSGELVPSGPTFEITAGNLNHGSFCVGSVVAPITYTVSNTGADAFSITVTSDNPEFSVSNLSQATILSGTSATFDVTFTPAASGTRNAIITIATTTPNGNAPLTLNVTGDGIAATTYYADTDNDTYGDLLNTQSTCDGAPQGFVSNSDDCDDTTGAINPNATEICDGIDNNCDGTIDEGVQSTFYADTDNDNFGNPAVTIMACSAPAGYVSDNTDCNDGNGAINPGATEICDGIDNNCNGATDEGVQTTYYADGDNDGYGNPSVTMQACSAPANYVSNNTDCNDANGAINPGATEICDGIDNNCNGATDEGVQTTYYADGDNDGYGNPSVTMQACSTPFGSVSDNTDCNDANGAINPGATEICDGIDNDCDGSTDEGVQSTFYADSDNDTYGDPEVTMMACSAPAGYVANNTDCNDNNNQVRPNRGEIGYNLIDDNCNGSIDEGFPPKVTGLQGAFCNNTLAAIDTQLVANIVAGANGYRWRITTLNGPNANQVQTLDTALRTMKLTQLLSYAFNTQYKVEVAVYFAGFLQPYNMDSCTVTTPAPTTSLSNCFMNLTSISNPIYANLVPYAAGYRFKVSDPFGNGNVQIIERPIREFKLSQITDYYLNYNRTYFVEVSVKNTDGTWLPYSFPCYVTTPSFPTTSLQDSQCDGYMVPANSTQVYASSYPGAIGYVFQFSGGGLPSPIEVAKGTRSFTMNDFAGQIPAGGTYNVKVRLIFNTTDPIGPYGKTCLITTPAISKTAVTTGLYDAIAHPNPFADSFNIEVTSASGESTNIKVYDMMGRLLQDTKVKSGSDMPSIGSHFPAGVYNVTVTQGENSKTLRVVKR